MIDVEPLIASELERLLPLPDGGRADWQGVLVRAGLAARSPQGGGARGGSKMLARRRLVSLGALPVAAAVLVAVVLTWPLGASPSLLERAAAAIGDRPVTHVVLQTRGGASLVDLRTGKRSPVFGHEELWYDPLRGLLLRSSFRGHSDGSYFATARSIESAQFGGKQWLASFVSGYRAGLRTGEFHLAGSGSLYGTPVYWIESKPSWTSAIHGGIDEWVEQVAISQTSYRPLFMRQLVDGRIQAGSGVRVLTIESIPRTPGLFRRPASEPGFGWTPSSPSIGLAQARTISPSALIPARLDGLRRVWIAKPAYVTGPPTDQAQVAGVAVFYGRLGYRSEGGWDESVDQPDYRHPFISITEFPTRNVVVRKLGLARFPSDGTVLLNGGGTLGSHTATLQAHGLYVIITASSDARALAAARALTNAPTR